MIPLDLSGFNASLIPLHSGSFHSGSFHSGSFHSGWIGTQRRQIVTKNIPNHPKYPEVISEVDLFYFDSNFQLEYKDTLKDCERTKYTSFSGGFEDCRLLSDSEFLCVTCDTNPNWRPEVSYVQFDKFQVKQVTPLAIPGIVGAQKNWIPLYREGDQIHLLQNSGNPFRIVTFDTSTLNCSIVKEYSCPQLKEFTLHNGSALQINDGFLVTARKKKGYSYDGSIWILLDKEYNYKGHSNPFYFIPGSSYEMCMSLNSIDSDTLIASVGIDDKKSCFFQLSLKSILDSILITSSKDLV